MSGAKGLFQGGKTAVKTSYHTGALVNAGSNGDLAEAAHHAKETAKVMGSSAMKGLQYIKDTFMLEDACCVDDNGNNALHYLFLPLLEKNGNGGWRENEFLDYCNVLKFLFSETRIDPTVQNNKGKSPIDLVKQLMNVEEGGRTNTMQIDQLMKMHKAMESAVVTRGYTRKAKAAAAVTSGYYVASYAAVPYLLWNWMWWLSRIPVRIMESVGVARVFGYVGITGAFSTTILSWFLTLTTMSLFLWWGKRRCKRALGMEIPSE